MAQDAPENGTQKDIVDEVGHDPDWHDERYLKRSQPDAVRPDGQAEAGGDQFRDGAVDGAQSDHPSVPILTESGPCNDGDEDKGEDDGMDEVGDPPIATVGWP